jgi:hypothetical protein
MRIGRGLRRIERLEPDLAKLDLHWRSGVHLERQDS